MDQDLKTLLQMVKEDKISIEDAEKKISANGDKSAHLNDYISTNFDSWVKNGREKGVDGNIDTQRIVDTSERFKLVDAITAYYKPKQTLTKYIKEKTNGRGLDFKTEGGVTLLNG